MPYKLVLLMALSVCACQKDKGHGLGTGFISPATPSKTLNIITAGQSNMTNRINGHGIPSYVQQLLNEQGIQVQEANTAIGNTSLDTWVPGGSGYASMFQAGQAQGHTDFLIFWQGEDEARSKDIARAAAWGQKFTAMIQQLRHDLNEPNLQVIFCQIGPEPTIEGPYTTWRTVQDQQSQIYIQDVQMVKTDDQNFEGWLHTNEQGYRVIADRIVTKILQITP